MFRQLDCESGCLFAWLRNGRQTACRFQTACLKGIPVGLLDKIRKHQKAERELEAAVLREQLTLPYMWLAGMLVSACVCFTAFGVWAWHRDIYADPQAAPKVLHYPQAVLARWPSKWEDDNGNYHTEITLNLPANGKSIRLDCGGVEDTLCRFEPPFGEQERLPAENAVLWQISKRIYLVQKIGYTRNGHTVSLENEQIRTVSDSLKADAVRTVNTWFKRAAAAVVLWLLMTAAMFFYRG